MNEQKEQIKRKDWSSGDRSTSGGNLEKILGRPSEPVSRSASRPSTDSRPQYANLGVIGTVGNIAVVFGRVPGMVQQKKIGTQLK